jgi:hypothetical protein
MKCLRDSSAYQTFRQNRIDLTGETRGTCFRVSYRWLRFQLLGRSEKKNDWTHFDESRINVVKTTQKQAEYLDETAKVSKDDYGAWFTKVDQISLATMQAWGQFSSKHRHSCSKTSSIAQLSSREEFTQDNVGMIIGLYGTQTADSKAGCPWAHAVAYCRKDGVAMYYDINSGEWGFEDAEVRGTSVESKIKADYTNDATSKKIIDLCVYRITT